MASFADAQISLDRGDTDYLDLTATQADGTPQDITGWTITFTAKRGLSDADADAVIHKTTMAGTIVITNGAGGLATVNIVPADTSGLVNRAQRFYGDLVGKDPMGGVNRLWRGFIRVSPIATESP